MLFHNNKYSYDLVEYVNSKTKVKIICPIHGIFEQTPYAHTHSYGCVKCANQIRAQRKTLDLSEFIKRANIIHNGKYTYNKTNYTNSKHKVNITCPKHGLFKQTPIAHMNGQGCPNCGMTKKSEKAKKGLEYFIEKSKLAHNGKYDYTHIKDFNILSDKLRFICPRHGEFYQMAKNHIKGVGCPMCRESKGELIIEKFLLRNQISYKKQMTFDHCRGIKNKLPFDFYLPQKNILIEFDGLQHFKPEFGIKSFIKVKRNDKIKNEFAKLNNIELIRLSVFDKNLDNELKNKLTIYTKEND